MRTFFVLALVFTAPARAATYYANPDSIYYQVHDGWGWNNAMDLYIEGVFKARLWALETIKVSEFTGWLFPIYDRVRDQARSAGMKVKVDTSLWPRTGGPWQDNWGYNEYRFPEGARAMMSVSDVRAW
jgi:hypothetical protein